MDRTFKMLLSSFCVGHCCWMGSGLKNGVYTQWVSVRERELFYWQAVISCIFWVRIWACVHSSFNIGVLSGPDLCRPWVFHHNFCEFTCGSLLPCLEGHVSLVSSIPLTPVIFLPLLKGSLSLKGREIWWRRLFRTILPGASFSSVSSCGK